MKLRLALVGLVALGGAALTAGMASAMPLAPLGQSQASNVESVCCGLRSEWLYTHSTRLPTVRLWRPSLWLWRASRLRLPSRLSPLVT